MAVGGLAKEATRRREDKYRRVVGLASVPVFFCHFCTRRRKYTVWLRVIIYKTRKSYFPFRASIFWAKTRIFIFSSFENRRLGGEIAARSEVNFVNEQTKTLNLGLPAADKVIALLSLSSPSPRPLKCSLESPL